MNLLAICPFLCYHSLLMLIVSHAFVFFPCKNQSVCIFTLIFLSSLVLVLGFFFFNQLIIIVFMLLWLQTVPRIKWKKKKTQLLFPKLDALRGVRCQSAAAAENDSDRRKPSTARMIRPIALAHPLSITSTSPFMALKVVSFPFKWSPLAELLVAAIYL